MAEIFNLYAKINKHVLFIYLSIYSFIHLCIYLLCYDNKNDFYVLWYALNKVNKYEK